MNLSRIGCVVLSACVLVLPAFAGDNEFGILAGGTYLDKNLNDDDSGKLGPTFGLRFGHTMGDAWLWFADATYSKFDIKPTDDGLQAWTVRTGPEIMLSPNSENRGWFLAPALGMEFLEADDVGLDANRGLASLGLGYRAPTGSGTFSAQARYDHVMGKGWANDNTVGNVQFLLGYAWGLGGPPKDSDGDGVIDRKDKCPDTPSGARVDAVGCPSDGDGDGVFDGLDKCPDTTKGWPVDASGCTPDADGDGVVDPLDKCPNTPRGTKVDANGCPVDSDGDGVTDDKDRCPGTARGVKVDANGCPLDSDGDGVTDDKDRCPDTPRGTKVDANGCPEQKKEAPLFTPEKRTLVLEGVYFDTDKATLKPESVTVLDRVAASLRDWPEVRVEVGGHTDSRGSNSHNQKLSEARAQAVRDYLVDKGIDASRITAKGYGEGSPIDNNNTEEGRQKNRRVELKSLD